ncbi:MAG TPA: hypothetical protein VF590_26750, partial [Isosphaeraceae bacterium]
MRFASSLRHHPAAALGLAASLLLTVAGCGGQGEGVSETVVVPEPGTNLSTAGSPTATGTPTPTTPAAGTAPETATTSGAAAVKAEGWGTLRGRVVLGGTPPQAKILVAQGDPNAKDAAICAAQAIKSDYLAEWLARPPRLVP